MVPMWLRLERYWQERCQKAKELVTQHNRDTNEFIISAVPYYSIFFKICKKISNILFKQRYVLHCVHWWEGKVQLSHQVSGPFDYVIKGRATQTSLIPLYRYFLPFTKSKCFPFSFSPLYSFWSYLGLFSHHHQIFMYFF